MRGTTIVAILDFKYLSAKSLSRYFSKFLNNPPHPIHPKAPKDIFLKIDAKYFGKKSSKMCFCVLLYKEGRNLIYWRFARRETFNVYVEDMILLTNWGYKILGVTSDWHPSLVGAVKHLFKHTIPHQRCLVHTQRRCENLLTKNPKTEAGTQLLELIRLLNKIYNHYDKKIFIQWFKRLEIKHTKLLKEKTLWTNQNGKKSWCYTHKKLRLAFRTISSDFDSLFLYLDCTGLEKDTNGLESEFSHLVEKIQKHRGMTFEHKKAAISWYIQFVSNERLSE